MQRQREIVGSMKQNAENIAKEVELLPQNPPVLQKQIDVASQQAADIAKKGIEASGSYARARISFSVSFPRLTSFTALFYQPALGY